jgi:hypothetical protein
MIKNDQQAQDNRDKPSLGIFGVVNVIDVGESIVGEPIMADADGTDPVLCPKKAIVVRLFFFVCVRVFCVFWEQLNCSGDG